MTTRSTAEPHEPSPTIPVVEERVIVSKRTAETGEVEIRTATRERIEHVEAQLVAETVEVRRVPRGVVVAAVPEIRTEGDTTVIPVVEEEIVIEKRLVLREEVHVTRRREERRFAADVPVAASEVTVERREAGGRE